MICRRYGILPSQVMDEPVWIMQMIQLAMIEPPAQSESEVGY